MRFIIQYIKETPQLWQYILTCISAPIEHWMLNVERYMQCHTRAMPVIDGVRAFNVNKLYHSVWQNSKRNEMWVSCVFNIQYMQINICLKLHIHWHECIWVPFLACVYSKSKALCKPLHTNGSSQPNRMETMKRGWAAVRRRIYAQLTFSYWIEFNMATSCRAAAAAQLI